MDLGKITVLKSAVIFEVMERININNAAISGPIYGIKFNNAHRKAMMNAFSILKISITVL